MFEKQKHITGVTQCYLQLGKIEAATGNTHAAIALFLQGQEMASMAGDKNHFTVFLLEIAGEKLKAGIMEEAVFAIGCEEDCSENTGKAIVNFNQSALEYRI